MGKKIALLEDDRDYREVLTKYLEKEGYEVYAAPAGYTIVKDILENQPDLILADLMLPVDRGDEVIEHLKKENVLKKDIPVIIISSKDEPEIKEAAKKAGAVCYFKKPVDKKILLETIRINLAPSK